MYAFLSVRLTSPQLAEMRERGGRGGDEDVVVIFAIKILVLALLACFSRRNVTVILFVYWPIIHCRGWWFICKRIYSLIGYCVVVQVPLTNSLKLSALSLV